MSVKNLRYSVIFLIFLSQVILIYFVWKSAYDVSVLVEWSTASELDTAGFNLYRSETSTGPFIQINPELVPAASDPLAGSSYTYEDTDVRPGWTYYYQLEEVEINGNTGRFGPISVKADSGFPIWLPVGAGLVMAVLLLVWMRLRLKENPDRAGNG